ncbi:hypothetical protein AAF712_005106 [Marasmius tenuissimus]|uniref:Integrase catalytic domain-containing protein n=1 Tax=Marasmius tenuissimus TaxID=585030 RepID=A0ABR3A1U5_9AGAR
MSETNPTALLSAFRQRHEEFIETIKLAQDLDDSELFLLQLLGDNLEDFQATVEENRSAFPDESEWQLLRTNMQVMLLDIRQMYKRAAESSHRGRPVVVEQAATGGRGRPKNLINRDFLAWAYTQRTTAGIAHFLDLSRSTVRRALLQYGIVKPGDHPFPEQMRGPVEDEENAAELPDSEEDFLDADLSTETAQPAPPSATSGYLSLMDDQTLDVTLIDLRNHFPKAGIKTLQGMLRSVGHIVQHERIRQSLIRIDPVHRVFDRVRIKRRKYKVPGPNFLWHHDGHHALIRWGIVIHGFIDGYTRLITGLQASNSNSSSTVLLLFWAACAVYGVPDRLRGDHGVENVWVAAFMEFARGHGRGSYLWGRSVHNTRIERLWVDVRINVSSTWDDRFTDLELNFGLEYQNVHHKWLLQHLFLDVINEEMTFWYHSWNQHKIAMKDGPSRSPEEMFGFDMLAHGLRGDSLKNHPMTEEELELFGVDWEGFHDERILRDLRQNYANEETSSWIGKRGPPPKTNNVTVNPPASILTEEEVAALIHHLELLPRSSQQDHVRALWVHGLAFARSLKPEDF